MDNKGAFELDTKGSSSKRKNRLLDEHDNKPHHKPSREREEPQPAALPTSPKDEEDSGSFDAPLYRAIASPLPATTGRVTIPYGHDLPEDDLPPAGLVSPPLTRGISLAAAASVSSPTAPAPAFSASSSSFAPSVSSLSTPALQRLVSKGPTHVTATASAVSSLVAQSAASPQTLPSPSSASASDDLPSLPPKMLALARTASLQLQRTLSHTAPDSLPLAEQMSTSPVSTSSAGTGPGSRLSGLPAFPPVFTTAHSLASVQSAFDDPDPEEELKQEEVAEELGLAEEGYFSQSDDDMPPPMPGLGAGLNTNLHMQMQQHDMPDINPEDDDIPPMHPVLMRQAGGFFGGGGIGMAPAVPFLHMSRQMSE